MRIYSTSAYYSLSAKIRTNKLALSEYSLSAKLI